MSNLRDSSYSHSCILHLKEDSIVKHIYDVVCVFAVMCVSLMWYYCWFKGLIVSFGDSFWFLVVSLFGSYTDHDPVNCGENDITEVQSVQTAILPCMNYSNIDRDYGHWLICLTYHNMLLLIKEIIWTMLQKVLLYLYWG